MLDVDRRYVERRFAYGVSCGQAGSSREQPARNSRFAPMRSNMQRRLAIGITRIYFGTTQQQRPNRIIQTH